MPEQQLGYWLTPDETDRWDDSDAERQATARDEMRARVRTFAKNLGATSVQLRDATGGQLEVVSSDGVPEE
jgi:hypothetical protein